MDPLYITKDAMFPLDKWAEKSFDTINELFFSDACKAYNRKQLAWTFKNKFVC